MRRLMIYAAGISAVGLSLYGLSAGAATASNSGVGGLHTVATIHSSTAIHGTATKLLQPPLCGTSEGTYNGNGITAQNGGATNPNLQTWGGKQVQCTGGAAVHTVVVDGYPNQTANIKFNIEFYKNTSKYDTQRYMHDPQPNDGKKAICSFTDAPGTFAAAGMSGAQWTIALPGKGCKISKKVGKKPLWVAVQADYDQAGGQWFWATQAPETFPNESDWRDTTNFFGLGCISFAQKPGTITGDVGATHDTQDCLFGGDAGYPGLELVLE